MTIVSFIALWTLLSIPFGIAVGSWINYCEKNRR